MRDCVHILKSAQSECAGIFRFIESMARHASSFGYRTSVLFLGDGPLVRSAEELGILAIVIPWNARRNDVAGAFRVWLWLRRNPAHVAHVHHGGLSVRATCRLAGVKAIVQHVHGRILEPKGEPISGISFSGADAVVACSQAVADCLPQCHAIVIYAGVETGSQPPAAKSTTTPFMLGILGRLVPLKNVESVIRATRVLRDMGIEIHVDVAGTGPSEAALRQLVTDLQLADRVFFLGWRDDIALLLESWDLLVVPSIEEGFSLSTLEAMAAARPVIASRVGGLAELIIDGVTGRLLPPGDTDSLIQSLSELARDRHRLVAMGVEGWKRSHELFSAERTAQQAAELYDGLL